MNRVVYAVIAIVIVGAFLIFGGNNTPSTSSNTNSNNQPSNQSQTNKTPEATNAVSIANMAFNPADITVKKGTKVTWTNNDNIAHTVTESDNKGGPSSPEMAPGSSYSFTYDQIGTFSYHCSIHPDMTGTVTVTQ